MFQWQNASKNLQTRKCLFESPWVLPDLHMWCNTGISFETNGTCYRLALSVLDNTFKFKLYWQGSGKYRQKYWLKVIRLVSSQLKLIIHQKQAYIIFRKMKRAEYEHVKDLVEAICSKGGKYRVDCMEGHEPVRTVSNKELKSNGTKIIIGFQYIWNGPKVLQIAVKFQRMWNELLGSIATGKDGIQLTSSNVQPVDNVFPELGEKVMSSWRRRSTRCSK